MLRIWRAHKKSINCMKFSSDNSLLISGSNDGEICVWSTISLLDSSDCQSMPSLLHSWLEHNTFVTSFLTLACSSSLLIASSLDGTCKTWELITGKLIRTQVSAQAISAIALDPEKQFLFSGCVDGRIFINLLDAGLEEENVVAPMDQCLMVLSGHKTAPYAFGMPRVGRLFALTTITRRDYTGIGCSLPQFIDYLVESIKSNNVKLILEGSIVSEVGAKFAKLLVHGAKGMPLVNISFDRLINTFADDARANASWEIFKSFKSAEVLVVQAQKLSSVLTEELHAEKVCFSLQIMAA